MDIQLEEKLLIIAKSLKEECNLHSFLSIQESIMTLLIDREKNEKLKRLIEECKVKDPKSKKDSPELNIEKIKKFELSNRHDYKIKHQNGNEYYISGLDKKLKSFLPENRKNLNTRCLLAAIEAGEDRVSVEENTRFITERLTHLYNGLKEYKEDIKLQEQAYEPGDKFLNKYIKEDLNIIKEVIESGYKVIEFGILPQLKEVNKNIEKLENIEDVLESKEFNNYKESLNDLMKELKKELKIEKRIEKKRKKSNKI